MVALHALPLKHIPLPFHPYSPQTRPRVLDIEMGQFLDDFEGRLSVFNIATTQPERLAD